MSEHIKKIYFCYAGVYDALFGKIFEQGRRTAFNLMDVKPGETVLEVGVGTGLSLSLYPNEVQVTGIDISEEMLNKAKEKKEHHQLSHVNLCAMDASALAFADRSFDKVVASHVITVVPDPLKTLHEIRRVCKNDGSIFILNYTGSGNPIISCFEKLISPIRNMLGLGKHFNMDELLKKAMLRPETEQHVNFMNMCRVVKCRNIYPTDR
ncbi:MAG: methyltransferase domain-containing protein [Candidatus Brocadiaceae bacterium]|nr:methyltransferase domain-containing protein [Candidatus Brocadiaceae bacterium]